MLTRNLKVTGNVDLIGPRGVDDEAKYAEVIAMIYHNNHKVDPRIACTFNTYGPRMRAGNRRGKPNFSNHALKEQVLTKQKKSWDENLL
ncbi:MAG: hypothetical protein WBL02_02180 [Methanomethylovorans sp.]|uniref:hypothetical protein n=1 Tax=Methanomethylovorans sp. TaxID=2758717 RepID=UPI003C74E449